MKKQDRIAVRTPEEAVQVGRAERNRFSDSISLQVENGEDSAAVLLKVGDRENAGAIAFKGLVSYSDLKTPGKAQIHGGNIMAGTLLADLITAGVLRSKDEKSIRLDLEKGQAVITGSVKLSGEDEAGALEGALLPEGLQLARMGLPEPDAEMGILRQMALTEGSLVFTDPVNGKSLVLKLEDGAGRLTGLADPEEDTEAVNKAYMEAYVSRKMDELREALNLPVE